MLDDRDIDRLRDVLPPRWTHDPYREPRHVASDWLNAAAREFAAGDYSRAKELQLQLAALLYAATVRS